MLGSDAWGNTKTLDLRLGSLLALNMQDTKKNTGY